MLLDIKLEAIRKHALIRFEGGNRRSAFTPDLNVAAQNCSLRRELESAKSATKPVRMRTAVGIYERKNVSRSPLQCPDCVPSRVQVSIPAIGGSPDIARLPPREATSNRYQRR